MGLYTSELYQDTIEVEMTGKEASPGRSLSSISYRFAVQARAYAADQDGLWFDIEDLEKFARQAAALTAEGQGSARLATYSGFELTVAPAREGRGHYTLSFHFTDKFRGNEAKLLVDLYTQQLDDLVAELLRY